MPVMKRTLTADQVRELMRKRQGERTQKELADELGVTQQYLCDIFLGKREPGEKVLRALGMVRRTVYEQVTA